MIEVQPERRVGNRPQLGKAVAVEVDGLPGLVIGEEESFRIQVFRENARIKAQVGGWIWRDGFLKEFESAPRFLRLPGDHIDHSGDGISPGLGLSCLTFSVRYFIINIIGFNFNEWFMIEKFILSPYAIIK